MNLIWPTKNSTLPWGHKRPFKKTTFDHLKKIFYNIAKHDLFLLSSSISFYAALSLAPFVLIILFVTSLIGPQSQQNIIEQAEVAFSPQVVKMLQMIFSSVNEGVNIGTVSGVFGALVLLYSASMVFGQLRDSLDVIYGNWIPPHKKSTGEIIKNKLVAMTIVPVAAVLIICSLLGTMLFLKIFQFEGSFWSPIIAFGVNFGLYMFIFFGIHYFVPTKRPPLRDTTKIAFFTDILFMLGGFLMATYFKNLAPESIYGAAGSVLIFLTWSYYSSFIVFLTAEVFIYLKKVNSWR